MSVSVLVGPPAYNKTPSPAKTPEAGLYPNVIVTEDGQTIWVSVPQPDKLCLTVKLCPEHFKKGHKVEHPHDYGRMIMQALATGQLGAVKHSKYVAHAHLYTSLQVLIGKPPQPTYFNLTRTKKDSEGPHTLSIALNPRRLGVDGIWDLLEGLHKITGKRLFVGAMLADARVSRLDVAFDIVGLELSEMVVAIKKAGKRAHRSAVSGRLETIEVWPATSKVGQSRDRMLILYDKRAERLAAGEEPPHSPAPVVRVEITKKRFGNAPMLLSSVGSLANPVAGLRVGRARASAKPATATFLRYVELRRVHDAGGAGALLHMPASLVEQHESCLAHPAADIIDGNKAWVHWNQGIIATGTDLLIDAAKQKSSGVPSPDCPEMEVL